MFFFSRKDIEFTILPSSGSMIFQGRTPTPRGGGHQPIIWPNFPENCMKMKKIWRACKICVCRFGRCCEVPCEINNQSQEGIPVGCVLPTSVAILGSCLQRGVVCLGDDCLGGVCLGVCVCPGGCIPPVHCMLGHSPLWTEFLTHACENITFRQLLLRTGISLILFYI